MKKGSNPKKVSAFDKLREGLEDAVAYQRGQRTLTAREVEFRPLAKLGAREVAVGETGTETAAMLASVWRGEAAPGRPLARRRATADRSRAAAARSGWRASGARRIFIKPSIVHCCCYGCCF